MYWVSGTVKLKTKHLMSKKKKNMGKEKSQKFSICNQLQTYIPM